MGANDLVELARAAVLAATLAAASAASAVAQQPTTQQPGAAAGAAQTAASAAPRYESRLEILDMSSGARRVVYRSTTRFEAPNWSRDGRYLLINQQGGLFRIRVDDVAAGQPSGASRVGELERLDLGTVEGCNNDHGYSPDGALLAISCRPSSSVYVVEAEGGVPRRLTTLTPSYWHGWSPDGTTLAYVGQRDGDFDIYTMAVTGGPEVRLTTAKGLDDGPDYTADGQWIYFNSVRTGAMRIWRMRLDGSAQEQVTFDPQYGDWFPHPSPDGKRLVWVAFDATVDGHPPYRDVVLRVLDLDTPGAKPRVLFPLFGGQGTMNVPSWSPDSTRFAFVSYARVE